MKTSQRGIDLIKQFEGYRGAAYKCPAGVWTIGYGTTKYPNGNAVQQGDACTQPQAEEWLKNDLARFEKNVSGFVSYNWNQNEFDALVSFAYNLGSINQLTQDGKRDKAQIADKMLSYTKAGGVVLTGLVRRRQAERALFLAPCGSSAGSQPPQSANNPYRRPTQTVTSIANALKRKIKNYVSYGDDVRWVQWHLQRLGYDLGPKGIDGSCGSMTVEAIEKFQLAAGLVADGLAGPKTISKLEAIL